MKKIEILAPAGNMECLKAAISAGADAVYISGKKYGARAFANNFDDDEIKDALYYAHLRDVKIYVTVNTLIYENEMKEFISYVSFLYENGVDALIIQDIGAMDLIRQIYPKLELHASTQMNIHSLQSVKLLEKLNIKRAVLAREVSIDEIDYIKKNSNIELEVFVQGALCMCYSGCCLMSSLIGNRSGNRGTCTQCCRMKYSLIKNNKPVGLESYILSTKDLMTLDNIGKLIEIGVDSIKIEGRMKRKEYVYLAVKLYRKAVDSYLQTGTVNITSNDIKELQKLFNRKFTKGFLFNEDYHDIVNKSMPNHMGIKVGSIISVKEKYFKLKLIDDLNINDGIRIVNDNIGFIVTNMFVNEKRCISAKKGDIVMIKKKIYNLGDVYKTTDYKQLQDIDKRIKEDIKLPLNIKLIAKLNEKLKLILIYNDKKIEAESDYIVMKALNSATLKNDIYIKLAKLNDTVYYLNNLSLDISDNIFIPSSVLNNLRRQAVDLLNKKRLKKTFIFKSQYKKNLKNYPIVQKKSILIDSICELQGYDEIYNLKDTLNTTLKLSRIITNHRDINKRVLVSDLGSINKYKDVVTDFGLNVVNSYSIAFLHSLGVDKVTLSYELDYNNVKDIIENYHKRYHKHPNVEVIVSGYCEAMVCKYKLDGDYITDRFKNKFKIKIRDNYMYIYDYKKRNLKDNYYNIGVNWIRYNEEY